jgi:DNA-binding NarL/FixJ family response regulator
MMDRIRVLIADDQELVREGLRIVLNHYPDIDVVGVASDGAEAVRLAQDLRPQVVLMDLKMPVLNGVEATRRIAEVAPGTQVIILTTYDTDDWVFEGVRAGAHAYLLKESGSEAVVASIRAVVRGESRLDPAIARKVLDAFRRLSPLSAPPACGAEREQPVEPLTEREGEILELIAQGLNNREIAAQLSLNEGTIRNHSSHILSKLHAYDRTQAVIKAARQGIVRL